MNVRKLICVYVFILTLCFMTGCVNHYNQSSNGIPMPTTAKQVSKNTIEIPLPYLNNQNGGVRWIIQRENSPDNLVLTVIYRNAPGARFPIGKVGAGTHKISGSIVLDGKKYEAISITLNKDLESGTVRFKKE